MPAYQMKLKGPIDPNGGVCLQVSQDEFHCGDESPPADLDHDNLARQHFYRNYISNVGPHSKATNKLQQK